MIARDEGEHLRRCLESVASIVDAIYITDTGSTDDT
ncbi:MAG: glycosyltransferase involved in cell wall biosynthesis, partial [Candidatus Binatia bacterium]